MKTLSLLAASLSLSIFSLAHAETYDGVHAANSVKSRAEVAAEAERTAASPFRADAGLRREGFWVGLPPPRASRGPPGAPL